MSPVRNTAWDPTVPRVSAVPPEIPQLGDQQQAWQATTAARSMPLPPLRSLPSMGTSEDMWKYYRELSLESERQMEPNDPRHKAIPAPYVNGYVLDQEAQQRRSSFGYPMSVFRVQSREDGHLYCLRRFDNVRSVSPRIAAVVSELWTKAVANTLRRTRVVDHAGLVRFHRCFMAHRAVFFVHHYHAGARTLRQRFFHIVRPTPLNEAMIWSVCVQLSSAIRTVHSAKLACRTIQLNHILSNIQGSHIRVYINCIGVVDTLEFETRKTVQELQATDMRDFGYILLSLATATEVNRGTDPNTIRRCDMFVTQNYSRELSNLIVQLLIPTKPPPTIIDVSQAIASYTYEELDQSMMIGDRLGHTLMVEFDASRAMRLLTKLGFVNERPEFGMNRRWTESGDGFVLKLFRDYVFHQADGAGNPIMDLGHVVTCLNKVDAGDEERILLTARDAKTVLVVSYADIAQSLERAYGELCGGSVMAPNAGGVPHQQPPPPY